MSHLHSFLLFSSIFCLTSCINIAGDCDTDILKRIPNPNNTIQAIATVTDCGATTATSYGVRLVEGNNPTDKGTPENTILGSNKSVDIKWISNDTLLVNGIDTTNGFNIKTHLRLQKLHTDVVILFSR
ncbi:MAG: hypothetical protein JO154_07550 [Chitinophaga sp.]|uniref:hypothetical protein n=1 Tax=Chitinophaga sp. TaxID=1869181 RepID=UPI0025BD8E94|nr:hypothetical protein [Chitinophaga sp.]MBV8252447.1 hypothetical protein [Chitinophaga sp.]